jgi:hypothetical protein
MRHAELAFLCLLAVFVIGFLTLGLFHYGYSFALLRFPLLAGGAVGVLVAAQIFVLRRSEPAETAEAVGPGLTERFTGPARAATLLRICWLFSIVPLVFLCGYPWGLAIYLLCFLRSTRASWTLALAMAAASLLLSFGLFIEVLGVSLPVTPLWWPR